MKGAGGRVVAGLFSTRATVNASWRRRASASSASLLSRGRNVLPADRTTWKRQGSPPAARVRSAKTSQYSSGSKTRISRSRSTTSLTATDCTRPADRPRATFAHSSGDTSKPTTRSRNRRACCAFTRFRSISPGFSNASRMARRVISLKTTRRKRVGSPPMTSLRCQAMASPSRSRSVARKIRSEASASFLSSPTTFSLPGTTS